MILPSLPFNLSNNFSAFCTVLSNLIVSFITLMSANDWGSLVSCFVSILATAKEILSLNGTFVNKHITIEYRNFHLRNEGRRTALYCFSIGAYGQRAPGNYSSS